MAYCCVKYSHEASKTTLGVHKNIEEKNKWENALKTVFKKSYRACASHFKKSDIKSTWESGEGENKYRVRIHYYLFQCIYTYFSIYTIYKIVRVFLRPR
jgi:hypothetical protein